eukprot:2158795-Amphidinium_carterae.1
MGRSKNECIADVLDVEEATLPGFLQELRQQRTNPSRPEHTKNCVQTKYIMAMPLCSCYIVEPILQMASVVMIV